MLSGPENRRLSSGWLRALLFAGIFATGPAQSGASEDVSPGSTQFFDMHIAPLLARHCLECHDSTTRKGKLDLSRKDAAFAGGKHGKAIVPGKSGESRAWAAVESGEMPEDRPPLSAEELRRLRAWIDAGANWSGNEIDPLAVHRDHRAAQHLVRRLTVSEYIETVRSAVGVDVGADARRILPPDVRADGFSNTAYNLQADLGHIEAYARLARLIVKRMDLPKFTALFSNSRDLADQDALRELIARMGWWLLRGPLDEREIAAFLRIPHAVAADGGKYDDALPLLVEAMLQAPRFIYRFETPGSERQPPRLDHHALASRLSYLIWGAPPDPQLMRAADSCELGDRSILEAHVRRMLQDPRALARSLEFIRDWLNLDRLDNLRPDPKRYPTWSPALAADMRDETLAFFKEVAWVQRRPLSDLLNAELTFATPRLAAHYGLASAPIALPKEPPKNKDGLQALYLFNEAGGDTVHDVSGAGDPLDLRIQNAAAVDWRQGRLTIKEPTLIATASPPQRLIAALKKSRALTIEAWVTPADTKQSGPARIVTLSADPSIRNFTLGQDGDKFEARLRTSATSTNGVPALTSSPRTAHPRLTHIVYTRDASGRTLLYINGEERGAGNVGGDFGNWDGTFRLALANELTRDRPWRGSFHRVAIYSRALTSVELGGISGGIQRYELAAIPARGGLLTQGSLLTIGGDDASMVERGLFVLKDLLYSAVGNAPPGTDTTPLPTKPGQSQRAISEARLANKACSNCHSKFEPLAFALEKFDGIGAHREKDQHGNQLREDGEITLPGADRSVAYKTAPELMNLLAGSERVQMNFTRKLAQFALGRPLVESDSPALENIHTAASKNGGTYQSLITAIALSDLIQMDEPKSRPIANRTTP